MREVILATPSYRFPQNEQTDKYLHRQGKRSLVIDHRSTPSLRLTSKHSLAST